MKTTDLATLRLEAKQRCDQEKTTFIEDSEWNRMINRSADKLHNELVQIYGADYFIQQYNFSPTAGQKTYSLPDNFYKFLGLDAVRGSENKYAVRRFLWSERNFADNIFSTLFVQEQYRVVGNDIVFQSEPNNVSYTLWYAPTHINMSADSDTFQGVSGFDDFIVIDCARKAAIKEESFELAATLAQELGVVIEQIRAGARNRDADMPFKVQRRRRRRGQRHGYGLIVDIDG